MKKKKKEKEEEEKKGGVVTQGLRVDSNMNTKHQMWPNRKMATVLTCVPHCQKPNSRLYELSFLNVMKPRLLGHIRIWMMAMPFFFLIWNVFKKMQGSHISHRIGECVMKPWVCSPSSVSRRASMKRWRRRRKTIWRASFFSQRIEALLWFCFFFFSSPLHVRI